MWWKKEYRMWWSTWNLWKDKGSSVQLKNVESMVYTNHDKLVLSTVPALLGMAKDYKLTLHGVMSFVHGIDCGRNWQEYTKSELQALTSKTLRTGWTSRQLAFLTQIRSFCNATRLRFGRRIFLCYSWSFGFVGIRLWWGKSSEEYWCHQPDQAPQEDGSPKAGCSLQGQDASIDRSWVLKGAENCTESQQE